jgi:ketopantoate reductase
LKKLASELILSGVSKDSLDFAQRAMASNGARTKSNEKIAKVIKDIGVSGIKFDEDLLRSIQNMIKEKSHFEAMLFVAQHTASMQRDELHRVLTIFDYHSLSPNQKAEIIGNLNKIESGIYQ